jgi:N-acetylneuraminic acid mutarotase
MRRQLARLALLFVLVGGASLAHVPGIARAAGDWTPAAPPLSAHYGHTATPLPDGQVLIVGGGLHWNGGGEPPAVAERYDPVAARWTRAAAPSRTRYLGHIATLLADGRVLILGGNEGGDVAELYTPATDSWVAAAPPPQGRSNHTATRLPDGRILVVGGLARERGGAVPAVADVALYDPVLDRWSAAPSLSTARAYHSATLLATGQVLVAGGTNACPDPANTTGCLVATAELYDPATGVWSPDGTLTGSRDLGQIATLLADGRVLIVGGYTLQETGDLYDPATWTWRATSRFTLPPNLPYNLRLFPAAVALADGRVLLIGAGGAADPMRGTLLYNPATDTWTTGRTMTLPRLWHTATWLVDGRVLVVGGAANSTTPSAEIYTDDGAASACFAETNRCISGPFRDYWEAHGGLAINGYPLTDPRREVLEDGNEYTVQYFERTRLELHPENPPPYTMLVGQFGRQILRDRAVTAFGGLYGPAAAPVPASADATFFPEIGHNLGGRFRDYWLANGGLAQFGFPLTELFEERLENGTLYQVQYFERARFELHPENAAPNQVLLGQFGRGSWPQWRTARRSPDRSPRSIAATRRSPRDSARRGCGMTASPRSTVGPARSSPSSMG